MLGILIQIGVLAGLMSVFVRHEGDISRAKFFLIFVPLITAFSLLGSIFGACIGDCSP